MVESSLTGAPALPDAANAEEARALLEITRSVIPLLPDGVRAVTYRFGEDSEGSPAVWISFHADDDIKPSPEKIGRLHQIANQVRAAVLKSGTARWPYIEVVTE